MKFSICLFVFLIGFIVYRAGYNNAKDEIPSCLYVWVGRWPHKEFNAGMKPWGRDGKEGLSVNGYLIANTEYPTLPNAIYVDSGKWRGGKISWNPLNLFKEKEIIPLDFDQNPCRVDPP